MKYRFKIIGAGPAGSTLGCLLKRANHDVTIYDTGDRPDIIVGESLLPSMIEYLVDLDILEDVEKIGLKKPGATIYLNGTEPWVVRFSEADTHKAKFAFNVPRADFDKIFYNKALSLGCHIIKSKVNLKADESKDVVWIDDYHEDDFIIDASGRSRVVSNALHLDTVRGSRNDTALFAHLDNALTPYTGNIHMNVFRQCWSWRIPICGKVSVGFIAPNEFFKLLGETKEEQYENSLMQEFILDSVKDGARTTPVMRYSNYQLRSKRFFGKNWALVGDAGGFLDPVFSTGLFLSLQGSFRLATYLILGKSLGEYQTDQIGALDSWANLIESFYDGRFFSMIYVGNEFKKTNLEKYEKLEIEKLFSTVMAGYGMETLAVRSRFNFILDFCTQVYRNNNCSADSQNLKIDAASV